MKKKAIIIQGGEHEDKRGLIRYCNGFDLSDVRRFYLIEHTSIDTVRAWQGHQREQKWFFVTEGSFKMVLVQPDNWKTRPNF